MADAHTIDPDRLIPPPSVLRPALADALRRVNLLRRLLRLSESLTPQTTTKQNSPGTEALAHAAH